MMLSAFQNHLSGSKSADGLLWERTQNDSRDRLIWAKEQENSESQGVKANALHILSTHYRYGWFVNQNVNLADTYLRQSAELGHTQACYDIARQRLEDKEIKEAIKYVDIGLNNIEKPDFDCNMTAHNQKSMKKSLTDLRTACEYKASKLDLKL